MCRGPMLDTVLHSVSVATCAKPTYSTNQRHKGLARTPGECTFCTEPTPSVAAHRSLRQRPRANLYAAGIRIKYIEINSVGAGPDTRKEEGELAAAGPYRSLLVIVINCAKGSGGRWPFLGPSARRQFGIFRMGANRKEAILWRLLRQEWCAWAGLGVPF